MTIMCLAMADYIINTINDINNENNGEKIILTCKRLQKILYFFEINYMKRYNGLSAFKDDFYAWDSGPVIPDVYYSYMQFQEGFMLPLGVDYLDLDENVVEILNQTIGETRNYSTSQLIEFSHIENGPWYLNIRGNRLITKEEIYTFYKDKNNIYIA